MINVKELLEELKASPYEYVDIVTPHTGVVDFAVTEEGTRVVGPSGTWMEKTGTLLASLTRERNKKAIYCPQAGEVESIELDLQGKFVEAGTKLLTLRHYLTRKEVIRMILKKALFLFNAPERAKYYFIPEVDKKMRSSGKRAVQVEDGMEIFIMSRMKRETVLPYKGPTGIIYEVYFHHNENIDEGAPLVGICPPDQLQTIQEVVARVRSEWEEQE